MVCFFYNYLLVYGILKFNNWKKNFQKIIKSCDKLEFRQIFNKSLEIKITQLFPFASSKYDAQQAKLDIQDSVKNLNTRLLNLQKINKSLDSFVSDSSQLNWDELQNINVELSEEN